MPNISLISVDPELIIKRDSARQELTEAWEDRDICLAAKLHCVDSAKHPSRPEHLYRKDLKTADIAEKRIKECEGRIDDLVHTLSHYRELVKEESREIAKAFANGDNVDYALRAISCQPKGNKRLYSIVRFLKAGREEYGDKWIELREKVKSLLLEMPEGFYQHDLRSTENAKARELQFYMSQLSEMSAELESYNHEVSSFEDGSPEMVEYDKLEAEYQDLFDQLVSRFGKSRFVKGVLK